MIKTIMIEGRPVELNSSMGWVYRYREQFGHDILPDVMPLVEAALEGVAEIMDNFGMENDTKYVDIAKVSEALSGSGAVEMFVKLAGMEFITVCNIFWAMVKNADPSTPAPEEYINSFDIFPVEEIAPGLLYTIAQSSISSKNSVSLLTKLRKTIPSLSTWSQSPESIEG